MNVLFGHHRKLVASFVTYLYEKKRQELRPDNNAPIDGVKEILLRARELFIKKHKIRYHNLTSQTFQILLQYILLLKKQIDLFMQQRRAVLNFSRDLKIVGVKTFPVWMIKIFEELTVGY